MRLTRHNYYYLVLFGHGSTNYDLKFAIVLDISQGNRLVIGIRVHCFYYSIMIAN